MSGAATLLFGDYDCLTEMLKRKWRAMGAPFPLNWEAVSGFATATACRARAGRTGRAATGATLGRTGGIAA